MQPTREITDDEVETFRTDGVVPLRQVLPLEWVDQLRLAMDEVFDRELESGRDGLSHGQSTKGARADMVKSVLQLIDASDGPSDAAVEAGHRPRGRSIVETDACSWHDGLRQLYIDSPLGAIAARLTDSTTINLYSDQLFLKEPGSGVRTPWHQDQPYWLLQGTKVAVCWVPVDTVRLDSGAMGYVRGSHRWGVTYKPSDFRTSTGVMALPGMVTDDLADVPPIDANPDDYDIVRFEAEPGDVIVHDWKMLHGSAGNVSADRLRRADSVRLAGDDVTFHQRPSSPEPFRYTVGLAEGDPLDRADRFPRIFG
ncbi:MAG: phytanoyl-CoA dioxygenase family protein [Acidimicrobiales bacterium]